MESYRILIITLIFMYLYLLNAMVFTSLWLQVQEVYTVSLYEVIAAYLILRTVHRRFFIALWEHPISKLDLLTVQHAIDVKGKSSNEWLLATVVKLTVFFACIICTVYSRVYWVFTLVLLLFFAVTVLFDFSGTYCSMISKNAFEYLNSNNK